MTAGIIYFVPEYNILDPICTFLFSIIVFFTTVSVSKDCISVLMEGVPSEINIKLLESEISAIKGVSEVHDIHVW